MIELDLRLVFVVGKGVRLCVEKKLEERLSVRRSGTGCKTVVVQNKNYTTRSYKSKGTKQKNKNLINLYNKY